MADVSSSMASQMDNSQRAVRSLPVSVRISSRVDCASAPSVRRISLYKGLRWEVSSATCACSSSRLAAQLRHRGDMVLSDILILPDIAAQFYHFLAEEGRRFAGELDSGVFV